MSATSERRQDPVRIALQGLIDVSHGERPFAARAVDLSRGGMAMRASCLPSVGQVLECRFACGRAGPWIAATVEVAWARMKDERSGEFGVSFVDVDDRARLLIEELVAEQAALLAPDPSAQASEDIGRSEEAAAYEAAVYGSSNDRPVQQAMDYEADEPLVEPAAAHAEAEDVGARESAALAAMALRARREAEASHEAVSEPFPDDALQDEVDDEAPVRTESVSVPIAELVIDGASAPVQAEAIDAQDGRVTYAQPLGPWRIGGSVQAPTRDGDARQGNVERVELRLVGNVPMLAVTVDFAAEPRPYGEFEFGNTVQGAQDAVHDTEPDTDAPDLDEEPNRFSLITAHEFPAPSMDAALADDGDDSDEATAYEESVLAQAAEDVDVEQIASSVGMSLAGDYAPAPTPPVLKAPELDEAIGEHVRPREARASRETAVVTEAAAVDLHDPELEAMMPPNPLERARLLARQVRVRWLWLVAATRELLTGRWTSASGSFGRLAHTVVPALRAVWIRARSLGRTAWGRMLGTRLGAARRLLVGTWLRRRRRTTAAPSTERATRRRLGAGIGWALVGLLALGLAAYALLPMELVAGPLLHRAIEPAAVAPAEDEQASREAWAHAGEEIAADQEEPSVAAPQAQPEAKPSEPPRAGKKHGHAQAPAVESAAAKPAPKAQKPPTLPAAKGPVFGDAQVEGAERYVLRMSQPVRELRGAADSDGFSVVIPGSLAVDRAGPISAQHPAVRRSMILNRGDRSELTIRFEHGKKPSYQVRANGKAIEILLGS